MTRIAIEGLSKQFDHNVAVDSMDLTIPTGELFFLLGPSGSGKTTFLRMLAGLVEPDAGRIRFDGADVTAVAPHKRGAAMVFQSYALYPHLTVRENIGFGLRVRGHERAEMARKVEDVARILELTAHLDRKPAKLSGGQRQRVAMGRAIARTPKAFLMDEPLSNLDAKLRVQMRAEITAIQRMTGITTIYVTHDQVEAMTEPLGAETLLVLAIDGVDVDTVARIARDARARVGDRLQILLDPRAIRLFDHDSGRTLSQPTRLRTASRPGQGS